MGPKCCDKINSDVGNQCLDANGNQVSDKTQNGNGDHIECDCEGVEIDSRQKKSALSETNSIHQIDENIVKKLQSIALSDYGKLECSFPFLRHFHALLSLVVQSDIIFLLAWQKHDKFQRWNVLRFNF